MHEKGGTTADARGDVESGTGRQKDGVVRCGRDGAETEIQ
jgi:hypothetical protein